MGQSRRPGGWPGLAILAVAVAAGFVVLLLLFPASGVDTDPPQCLSTFGYTVPCGAELSLASGVVVAGVLGFVLLSGLRRFINLASPRAAVLSGRRPRIRRGDRRSGPWTA